MATIKSYTDINQSRKLAEILSLKSADMHWFNGFVGLDYSQVAKNFYDTTIDSYLPCWSLAALLGVLPNGNMLVKATDGEYYCLAKDVMTKHYDNLVDACVAMIIKLHELNLL